jgi:effector-binding domain-containing protein
MVLRRPHLGKGVIAMNASGKGVVASDVTVPHPDLVVEVREIPAQEFLGSRFMSEPAGIGPRVREAFSELYASIERAKATPTGPPFLIASEPAGNAMEIEVGAPCRPVPVPAPGLYRGRLEACRAAVVAHRGPYDEIGAVYPVLFAWLNDHGYRAAGRTREIYLNGPAEAATPAEYLTELVVPIAGWRQGG